MKPEKAGKGKPFGDLILQLLVAEIEEALNLDSAVGIGKLGLKS
jgi:hypothetical protein